ncbi:DUF6932 family protein [Reinekea thalattae]|uniref:Nucleotidyltransferase domain-containing protein n=1 Tax=Reinekea thalattae TaxID=2593301 RepID=A0A5C8ZAF6_9GAMM|nr:hypothetical protein [Reinekea thalattae]TXR54151.1 hypothetical protein FME95_06340 [Reinekea thalattae]
MEQKPLLEPGLHDFELKEIGNHFLKNFPASKTRKLLIDGLNSYVGHLASIGTPVELWIDGSFTTNKENPNDIDLVIFSPASALNVLPDDKKQLFQALTDRASIKANFGCDVLFCPTENQDMRSYWRGWYGFDRNEQPKGIARVMVAA